MSDSGQPPKGAVAVLGLSIVATLAVYYLPGARILAYPLLLLSTLAHELGHGITAVLVGGEFHRFEMSADGSGVAITATAGRIQRALVAAGGLVGPAVVAAIFFGLARRERLARVALGAVVLSLVLALVLVVRNLFGFAFVLVVAAACGAIARWGNNGLARFTLVFLAVQLALSVFSRSDYLFTDVARTANGNMPSDVSNMSEALFLPYWFWGALCGAVSVAVLFYGLKLYLKPLRR